MTDQDQGITRTYNNDGSVTVRQQINPQRNNGGGDVFALEVDANKPHEFFVNTRGTLPQTVTGAPNAFNKIRASASLLQTYYSDENDDVILDENNNLVIRAQLRQPQFVYGGDAGNIIDPDFENQPFTVSLDTRPVIIKGIPYKQRTFTIVGDDDYAQGGLGDDEFIASPGNNYYVGGSTPDSDPSDKNDKITYKNLLPSNSSFFNYAEIKFEPSENPDTDGQKEYKATWNVVNTIGETVGVSSDYFRAIDKFDIKLSNGSTRTVTIAEIDNSPNQAVIVSDGTPPQIPLAAPEAPTVIVNRTTQIASASTPTLEASQPTATAKEPVTTKKVVAAKNDASPSEKEPTDEAKLKLDSAVAQLKKTLADTQLKLATYAPNPASPFYFNFPSARPVLQQDGELMDEAFETEQETEISQAETSPLELQKPANKPEQKGKEAKNTTENAKILLTEAFSLSITALLWLIQNQQKLLIARLSAARKLTARVQAASARSLKKLNMLSKMATMTKL